MPDKDVHDDVSTNIRRHFMGASSKCSLIGHRRCSDTCACHAHVPAAFRTRTARDWTTGRSNGLKLGHEFPARFELIRLRSSSKWYCSILLTAGSYNRPALPDAYQSQAQHARQNELNMGHR